MDYTEADAKGWAETVAAKLRGAPELGKDWWAALRLLEAAALEGAKVSRLVADNAALVQALHSAKQPHAKGCLFTRGVGTTGQQVRPCPCGVDALFETSSPGAALLAEHEAQVSALQARVAELEAKVTQAHAEWDAATDRATEAEAERDALRAQVDAVPTLVRKTLHHHGLSASLCNESADVVRRALSALSAETKGVKS